MDHLLSKEQPRSNAAAMVKRPSWPVGAATPHTSILRVQEYVFRIPSGPLRRSTKALERASRETSPGGIAQLVERQLCKLDAAGSNPAASTTERRGGGYGGEGV